MKSSLFFALLLLLATIGCGITQSKPVQTPMAAPLVPVIASPLSYGSLCNGTGDDAVGINAALAFLRAQAGSSTPLMGVLQLPAGQCTLLTTINATQLASSSVLIQGSGGSLLCETNGQPCIDAISSSQLTFRDITISSLATKMPSIGLQVGRATQAGTAADMRIDHLTIIGYFTLACFYNLNAETQLVTKLNVQNRATNGYGAIYDGYNHFNATSAFISITEPVETQEPFFDNTCVSCRVTSSGAGSIPLWVGGTSGLNFVNSYVSQFNTGVAAVLYHTDTNLHFDAHVEATGLTSVFLLTGSSNPVFAGLFYQEHDFFGTVSMFALDHGVTAATLVNANLNIGSVHPATATWFDNPANYTVSGRVAGAKSVGWVAPGGGFSGTMCFQKTCTTQ